MGEPLRTLIITFDPPENIGGVEGRAIGYTKELLARGYFVQVSSFASSYKLSQEPFYGTVLFRYPSRPRDVPRVLSLLTRRVRASSVDSVFLLSGSITLLGEMTLLFCRTSGRNSVSFYYGKDILQARQSLGHRLLMAASLFLAKRVTTNSRFTASLLPTFARRKCSVLYPCAGIASTDLRDTAQEGSKKRILFVGRLVPRKGVDDLIKAYRVLREEVPDAVLEVVGDGEDRDRLQRLVTEYGLSDGVVFFGALRGEALYDRYRACRVFAMPSRTLKDDVEGFGTVFLEAGLFGKPSVGTYSGGIPEAVLDGVTGILVKEGDVKALVNALKTLLEDSAFSRKLGDNARQRVLQEFTWQVGTNSLVKILEGNEGKTSRK